MHDIIFHKKCIKCFSSLIDAFESIFYAVFSLVLRVNYLFKVQKINIHLYDNKTRFHDSLNEQLTPIMIYSDLKCVFFYVIGIFAYIYIFQFIK